MRSEALLPIREADLVAHNQVANSFLQSVTWSPKPGLFSPKESGRQEATDFRSPVAFSGSTPAEKVSLVDILRQVGGDPLLPTEEAVHILIVLREGIRIAYHVANLYAKSSGLAILQQQNQAKTLTKAQEAEFSEKKSTTAMITQFVLAYYVAWRLAGYQSDEVSGIQMSFDGIPEVDARNPVSGMQCALFYYGAYVSKSGLVNRGPELVKMTRLYFQALIDDLKMRANALKHAEFFTDNSYKLEPGEFCIRGFEADLNGNGVQIEFGRQSFDDIVGNRVAKHIARRKNGRLLTYDPVTQRNPMRDLRGFSPLSLGYGTQGTGKTMQIAANATDMSDRAKEIGITFIYNPFPDNVISTFQGGSAERVIAWSNVFRNPNAVFYGPIDESEVPLEDRTRQSVSEGGKAVVGQFLKISEGASNVFRRGNVLVDLWSNLPEVIDPAVLGRMVEKFIISGAESWEDFLDQDYLWWREFLQHDPGFVGMIDPRDYHYLDAQKKLKALSEISESMREPTEPRLKEAFARVSRQYKPDEHAFFAALFVEVKKFFPGFSSRDVRNIQRAVDGRVMDFDYPDDWYDDPVLFFKRTYDEKKAMIIELMKSNMKGLNFSTVRLEETIRYTESVLRISELGNERKINEYMNDMRLREEAARRLRPERSRKEG